MLRHEQEQAATKHIFKMVENRAVVKPFSWDENHRSGYTAIYFIIGRNPYKLDRNSLIIYSLMPSGAFVLSFQAQGVWRI